MIEMISAARPSTVIVVSARRMQILPHKAEVIMCNLDTDMPNLIVESAYVFPWHNSF